MDPSMTFELNIDRLFNPVIDSPPIICVEMSGNHGGHLDSALRFVSSAKQAGADLLKVQVYTPETITLNCNEPDFQLGVNNDWADYSTLHSLYQKAHTPWDWIEDIFELCNRINLPVFGSPFDESAVKFLQKLDCPIYKIASPEITDHGLIEQCAQTGKPVILSTGLASKQDLDEANEILNTFSSPKMILKCVSAYPTPIEDMNIASIPWIQETYKCAAGLSDHSIGPEAAYAATALGARMIEKHFCLRDDKISVDTAFSMPIDELPSLKSSINMVFSAIGKATLDLPKVAEPSLSGRRSLYVVKDIKKGEKFTACNVRSIRPAFGMAPKHLPRIIGRVAVQALTQGERLSAEKISGWNDMDE